MVYRMGVSYYRQASHQIGRIVAYFEVAIAIAARLPGSGISPWVGRYPHFSVVPAGCCSRGGPGGTSGRFLGAQGGTITIHRNDYKRLRSNNFRHTAAAYTMLQDLLR